MRWTELARRTPSHTGHIPSANIYEHKTKERKGKNVLLTIAVRSETVVPHKVAMFSIKTGFPWKTERSRTSPFRRAAWKL